MSDQPSQPRIGEIDVKNYMRVRRARLVLDGNTFVLSGQNEAGKSSFVQAVEDAFGGSKFAPAMPIRKGATEAVITIRLTDGSGRALKAEITHTKDSRRLVVKDADGKTQSSPQEIMNAFWAETSFDPSLFLISKPADQVVMLKKLGGLDFTALEKEYEEKFTLRTAAKREAERLGTLAAAKPSFSGIPAAEVSAGDIVAEIEKANTHNSSGDRLYDALQTARFQLAGGKSGMESLKKDADDIRSEIARLQAKLAEKESMIALGEKKVAGLNEAFEAAAKAHTEFKQVDTSALKEKLAAVDETNRKVRANAEKETAQQAARGKQAEVEKLTDRLDEINEAKAELLRNAKFPIPGMSIDGSDVTIDGIPLAQQSDMRRLAIGVEMAAAMNPGKPLMLVRHGNLFTPENFGVLEEIAKRRNLTCIVEIAGTNVAGAKLVFEDGVGHVPGEQQAELPTA